jgi:flavocytochrome c
VRLAVHACLFLPWIALVGVGIAIVINRDKRALHGAARFANLGEVKQSGLIDPPGGLDKTILVGKYKNNYLTYAGYQFVLLAAPTRSGKGVGIVVPNCLNYSDSLVVLDIKGENFDITSGFRKACGQEVYLFSPYADDEKTHRYNPLDYISSSPAERLGDIDAIGQGAGSLWQRTHTSTKPMGTGFISTYVENIAADANIQMVTSTTATRLIQDDTGRVTGVEAEDVNGNTYKFQASKGVVLATGGFAANSKMVNEYNTTGKWDDLSKVPTTNRFGCSQGDGIIMAQEIGAALSQMEQIQLLYLGNVKDGGLTKYPARCVNGTDQEIFINKNGERFVREDGRRDEICLQVLKQPDAMFYFLESADGDYTDVKTALTADGFTFQEMEEQGYIIIADTLDEMAEKLGCDAETLKATVDTFNASVDSGEDEFGRTLYSVKLENGPFVATPRQACLHHTMGGVKIDTEGRVLDESGAPIEGLVAAGEITGGIHGGNRLGGNAVVDTVVFGKLAGETITK